MTEDKVRPAHHHGNLRAALINAGIALLHGGGTEALTLRKAAAMAGVSHAAPAHHFDGIEGLRAAIVEEAFRLFTDHMTKARDSGPQDPRARLRGICLGYLRFAEAEPALFDLIFGFSTRKLEKHGISDVGQPAYMVLRDACAPFVPPGTDPVAVETRVWSLIHGYAALRLSGRFAGTAATGFDSVIALLDGIGTDARS